MSTKKLYRFTLVVVTIASLLWSGVVLYVWMVERQHRNTRQLLHNGQLTNEDAATLLRTAIKDYQSLQSLFPCYNRVAHSLSVFEVAMAENFILKGELDNAADFFSDARQSMQDYLSCSPSDGKAWLDYALLLLEEKGMDDDVMLAWKRSAYVAPHEGWLAEKRLYLALEFLPFFDEEAKKIAVTDIATLENSLSRRQRDFLKATGFKSLNELKLFLNQDLTQSTDKPPHSAK